MISEKENKEEKKENKKRLSKVIGLKNTISYGNDMIYMVSLGKGNEGNIEKKIVNREIEDIGHKFKAEIDKNPSQPKNEMSSKKRKVNKLERIKISQNNDETVKSYIDVIDPKDLNQLHAKDDIEKLIFGKTFDDNLHIQIAYNILDIKKQLAYYSNFIVSAIDGMLNRNIKDENNGKRDIVGLTTIKYPFECVEALCNINNIDEELEIICQRYEIKDTLDIKNNKNKIKQSYEDTERFKNYAVYFGNAFVNEKREYNPKIFYGTLATVSWIRHNSYHTTGKNPFYLVFNMDKEIDSKETNAICLKDFQLETLNYIIKNRLDEINDGFVNKNSKNLNILFKVYPDEEQENLICDYYDFLILKKGKNLGISIKGLREQILTLRFGKHIKDKEYDSIRAKLYNILDFMIFKYYKSNDNLLEDVVDKLRGAKDEKEKEEIYNKEAESVWRKISCSFIENVLSEGEKATEFVSALKPIEKNDCNSYKEKIKDKLCSPEKISTFVKAVYAMTLFLDSKEINMFLNMLINKFSNIASMADTLNVIEGDKDAFENSLRKELSMFKDCKEIAEHLRLINSIARMNKGVKVKKNKSPKLKKIHYFDAGALFGETDLEKKCKKNHSLRNFIINNVIVSRQYNYIVRFLDTTSAYKIAQNKYIVRFVLDNIPDEQIEKYAKRIGIVKEYDCKIDFAKARKELAKKISEISLSTLNEDKREENAGLIKLYLTVIYLFVKNLVRVNGYYTMAIACLERDTYIMYDKDWNKKKNKKLMPYKLVEMFYDKKYLSESTKKYYDIYNKMDQKNKECSKQLFDKYRNAIVHLDVVSRLPKYIDKIHNVESYFDIYFTLMFFILLELSTEEEKIKIKSVMVKNNKTNENMNLCDFITNSNRAHRDFVKLINLPFAYCEARYINLTNKGIFLASFGK